MDTIPQDDSPQKQCKGLCRRILPATPEFFYQYKKGGYLHPHCKECVKQERKNYRTAYPEELKQYHRRDYQIHREERLIQYRQRYENNREAVLEQRKQDRQERPEVYRARGRFKMQRRRALHRNITGALTAQQIQAKLQAQKYACYYAACGYARFEQRADGSYIYNLEHIVPVSRTELAPRHDIDNVVIACPSCNRHKSDKLPHEWPEGGRLF